MIVKKVKANPRMPKRKAAHIRDLTDYLTKEDVAKEEKVLYVNGCHFLSTDYAAQQTEMMALADAAPRSRHPVNHWILSWREGEQPSFEQADQAVAIFLDELGLKGHQALYALHRNTDNVHLHIAVNRVHPETYRAIEVHHGFDREAAHRAIARIEQAQGWQREPAGRYHVLENGEVARAPSPERRREPEQRQRDLEQRLERRGENLYYTPLSDSRHHILIDDMDRGKLERLINDGYKVCFRWACVTRSGVLG